jgi:hypothetical protein
MMTTAELAWRMAAAIARAEQLTAEADAMIRYCDGLLQAVGRWWNGAIGPG